jgi:hypothetical protein
MFGLVAVGCGIGVLLWWLTGSWSGRIVGFLGLSVIGVFLAVIWAEGHHQDPMYADGVAIVVAYFVSGLPRRRPLQR